MDLGDRGGAHHKHSVGFWKDKDSQQPQNAHRHTRENDKLIVIIRLESVLIDRCKITRKANIREWLILPKGSNDSFKCLESWTYGI